MLKIPSFNECLQTRRHKRLVSFFNVTKNDRVLDISCGEGDVLAIIHTYEELKEAHGIDISETSIEKARIEYPWGTFAVADASALPYPAESFSTIVSCLSLHHYKNPEKVFREIARVLVPQGQAHIIDMIPRWRWSQYLHNKDGCSEPYHFEKYYRKEEIKSLAQTAGLCLEKNTHINSITGIQLLTFKKMH
jgi:ubiquinone/menaquinone biosynthesis C-methylase UbiE